jgi:hypothetical protein
MSVSVLIPIEDAVAWEPWLETELGVQAGKFGLGYDGGEEDGPFEVFDFTGDPEQVERAVGLVLVAKGVRRKISRADNFVTVEAQDGRWLAPLASKDTQYGKALHRVAREVSRDDKLTRWLAETGKSTIRFHEAHEPGRAALFPGSDYEGSGEVYLMHFTDLTMVNEDPRPTKSEAEKVAREHVREVLEAVAEHLGHPLPTS